jgi:hypothetical protein
MASLFDGKEVKRLAGVYNKTHRKENPITNAPPAKMWTELQQRLHSKCAEGTPSCIVSSLIEPPNAPADWAQKRTDWLSSDDIDKVEKQYVKLFDGYYFVGCVPIDFDKKSELSECIVSTLCSMRLDKLVKKGKTRIGIVFNTDTSDGPGEHWIAAFCDVRPELEYPRMTYFDSYAHMPESQIVELMGRWQDQWDAVSGQKPMHLTYNTVKHQKKDTECGMYCLYFHWACLMNIPMDKPIPDDVMNAFRNLLFRMPEN